MDIYRKFLVHINEAIIIYTSKIWGYNPNKIGWMKDFLTSVITGKAEMFSQFLVQKY